MENLFFPYRHSSRRSPSLCWWDCEDGALIDLMKMASSAAGALIERISISSDGGRERIERRNIPSGLRRDLNGRGKHINEECRPILCELV